MKCSKCQSDYQVDGKGKLFCPVCNSGAKKLVKVLAINYHEIVYYKVYDSKNISTETFLFGNEIDDLIQKGVEVEITR